MPDWAIHCGDSIRVSGEGGTRMDDDRFRARIWEHVASAGADGIPEALIRKADSEMKAAGYKCLTQAFPQYGHRTFLISLYERRPPTLLEAAKACVSMWRGGERGSARLCLPEITALEEAIAREEAS